MFETHRASNSVEDLVNAAATGDVGKIEQLLEGGACGVDDKFDGKTALQTAAQNGHIDVVRALTRYNVCLEEAVSCSELFNCYLNEVYPTLIISLYSAQTIITPP